MEIRSITLFCDPDFSTDKASAFFAGASGEVLPLPLQTRRLALPPFPDWWERSQPATAQAQALAAHWREAGADYVSVGPVQLRHDASWLELLPRLLGQDDMLFASAEVASTVGDLDPRRCLGVARVIRQASDLLDNGFGNLYFTALANCPAGSPFFPVAYHGGGDPAFAFAVEAADLAVRAFEAATTLDEARKRLISAIEREASVLTQSARKLADTHGLTFGGIDFSLAPFPEEARSLGRAMELLGLPSVGAPGSLFAAAFITEALDAARFPRCGFSGLMLPVLEDAILAARVAQGRLSLSDLLSYCAVCGVGLDTIPLPGAVSEEALAGILLDVAALATRLDKPLTARLMPLPGLAAGDDVDFDFPYFASSRVMALLDEGLFTPLRDGARLTMASLNTPRNES
ncbi:MAG TPA: DUF711 family protein [Candidatus Sulfomarinibacteraceae bacterium]|nr:DUF711 family protein [Candidatus Sulfomarinibacteraceae bacterium]